MRDARKGVALDWVRVRHLASEEAVEEARTASERLRAMNERSAYSVAVYEVDVAESVEEAIVSMEKTIQRYRGFKAKKESREQWEVRIECLREVVRILSRSRTAVFR